MYTESERQIYGPYFSGVTAVYADPIRVRRLLTDLLDGNPGKALAALAGPIPELRIEATERVLRAVVVAFGLVAFDPTTGQGLREDEVKGRLDDFLAWWAEVKKKPATSPTSPPSSGSGNAPTTPPSAACGPTSPAPGWPPPSPSPAV